MYKNSMNEMKTALVFFFFTFFLLLLSLLFFYAMLAYFTKKERRLDILSEDISMYWYKLVSGLEDDFFLSLSLTH